MLRYLLALCLALSVLFGGAGDGQAQGVLSILNQDQSSEPAQNAATGLDVSDYDRWNGGEAPMPMGTTTLMTAQTEAQRFRETLARKLATMPVALNEVVYILGATSPTGEIWAYFEVLFLSLALFFAGWLVERYVLGPFFGVRFILPLVKEDPVGYTDKLPYLLARLLFGVLGIAMSMAVAYLLGYALFGEIQDSALSFTALLINVVYFGARFASLFWRMVLAPFIPQYRIPPFSDRNAKKLFYWLSILALLDMFALAFSIWIAELGLNYDVYALIAALVGLMMAIGHTSLILANRRAISIALRRGLDAFSVSFMLRVFSVLWAPLLIVYFGLSWVGLVFNLVLERETDIAPVVAAYSVLIAMMLVYAFMNYAIERFFRRARLLRDSRAAHAQANSAGPDGTPDPMSADMSAQEAEAISMRADGAMDMDGDGDEEGGHAPQRLPEPTGEFYSMRRHNAVVTFEDLAHRVAGILTLGVGIVVIGMIWGASAMITEGAFIERVIDILAIGLIGYVAYHAFRVWIDQKILEEAGPEPDEPELGDEGAGASASRLATLLPLFRNTVLVIIVISMFLIGLLEMGVNVSPLFAGAGVVGIAIGFGAQSLVRDIFSGAFFLFDDAFRKGEYIDIGSVKGTVEHISVRSFKLRHHLGPLHTIPFGEIQYLTNYSRDWVIMKLPLRVTYDTDVEHVRKLIKKLGVALLDDPVIGSDFIQPLKSQGVIEMQDSAMIIRVKFMTKPGDQWIIRKRVYQEIRELFAREGIKFAHREVTVRLADGADPEDLTEDQKQAVAAAARQAVEEDTIAGAASAGDTR